MDLPEKGDKVRYYPDRRKVDANLRPLRDDDPPELIFGGFDGLYNDGEPVEATVEEVDDDGLLTLHIPPKGDPKGNPWVRRKVPYGTVPEKGTHYAMPME